MCLSLLFAHSARVIHTSICPRGALYMRRRALMFPGSPSEKFRTILPNRFSIQKACVRLVCLLNLGVYVKTLSSLVTMNLHHLHST